MVSSAIASRALTPSGRRRCAPATTFLLSRIVSNHAVLIQAYPLKPKNPADGEVFVLVGPGGFEPPTSTMSRPIGRTKTRVDTFKLAYFSLS